MQKKSTTLAALTEEYQRWCSLIPEIKENDRTTFKWIPDRSVKDILAHLMAWQQFSIARMEAGLQHLAPVFITWPAQFDPESDEDLDQINAWIFAQYHPLPWDEVYQAWDAGFNRFVFLSNSIPETDFGDTFVFPWLHGYALADVVEGSIHHHREHREELLLKISLEQT